MSWLNQRSVVVPVDFSDASKAAVDLAMELVDAPEHVNVIHVSPSIFPTEIGYVWEAYDEKDYLEKAEAYLKPWLADEKYHGVNHVIKMGSPGEEIVSHAQEVGAELVVIPSHGRTGLKRLLLGSVAERVVRLAECPVLVLKPPT
jgi:nucleotide-binding universal stress UspA family protein